MVVLASDGVRRIGPPDFVVIVQKKHSVGLLFKIAASAPIFKRVLNIAMRGGRVPDWGIAFLLGLGYRGLISAEA